MSTTIQSLQNPFRDWNETRLGDKIEIQAIQSLQNPFRDWNGEWLRQNLELKSIQSLQNPFRDWNKMPMENFSFNILDSKPPKPF